MAQSNSKLDTHQKQELREMRASQKGVKVITNGETTIAYKNMGKVVSFATSVSAPEEKKFRRKVGEFYARLRWDLGCIAIMTPSDFDVLTGEMGYLLP